MERVGLGCVPRSITVVLEADLVDKFTAGDDVVIVGQLLRQWKPLFVGNRCQVDIAVKANSLASLDPSRVAAGSNRRLLSNADTVAFDHFWKNYSGSSGSGSGSSSWSRAMIGRNIIVKSVCPQLYGLFYVKLALLLTLVGVYVSLCLCVPLPYLRTH